MLFFWRRKGSTFLKPIGKYHEGHMQSLYGHTHDALAFLKDYLEKEHRVFNTFCERWNIEFADLIKSIFLTIYLHDTGKLTNTFQKNIAVGKPTPYKPHPLAGLPIIRNLNNFFPRLLDNVVPFFLESTAILSHHTQAYAGLYSNLRFEKLDFKTEDVEDFINTMRQTHSKLCFDDYFQLDLQKIDFGSINLQNTELKNGVDYLRKDLQIVKNKIETKAVFVFIYSLLKLSDIQASANFTQKVKDKKRGKKGFIYDELYDVDSKLSFSGVTSTIGNWHLKPMRQFQEVLNDNPKQFSMLLAPCGRGKTDGSLRWATKLIDEGKANRIIFALPTQVTCNAMLNTLSSENYFGLDKVGLYHSRSVEELSERERKRIETESDEDISEEENLRFAKDENFRGEIFFHPITVTTVDHILYSFIHGYSKADFSLGHLQSAAIIFDEIHYYDNQMLGNLVQLFRVLRQMKIPHILMSGTFPKFLREKIDKSDEYLFVKDDEGLSFNPFEIIKEEKYLINEGNVNGEVLEKLMSGYKKGLKQIVILNTIQSAQLAYRELIDSFKVDNIQAPNIKLLHSRFIYKDRRDIEASILENASSKKEIQENGIPFILVATQVIEVSLDISSHRLFTECAPIDSMGQRGGRLNRGGSNPGNYKMMIFNYFNHMPYEEDLLQKSWEILAEGEASYLRFNNACDEVYKDRRIPLTDFYKFFEECVLFGRKPSEIRWNNDSGKIFKARQESYKTIDVYPMDLFSFYGNNLFESSNKFSIKVPAWWYWLNKKEDQGLFCEHDYKDRTYLLCKLPYNKKIGLTTIGTKHVEIEQDYPQNI